ncbi:Card1-like endonuclease domain-containing protein [Paraglaciecola sp. L1A13]|uniref:Card1-like endonuclease domain-containing protein n=1 Tax=Paraglaciecola sp. L1A13 TaxID=2686359 RepID=UPI0018EF3632
MQPISVRLANILRLSLGPIAQSAIASHKFINAGTQAYRQQCKQIDHLVDAKTVKNELDTVAIMNKKLHIIECKTKRIKGADDTHILYKLNSRNELLRDIAGKTPLASLHQITNAHIAPRQT